jgi:hypothetical protein
MSASSPVEVVSNGLVALGKWSGSLDWPLSEAATIETLTKVMLSRMDRWSLSSLIQRLRQPGRLLLGPALFLPILIIQARKILSGRLSNKERGVEMGLLVYMLLLIFVVQEVTREEG